MKYYIKQKVFSWRDRFHIYDANGADRFSVEGEVFSFGKKLHLYDAGGTELSFIHQKVFSFLPHYYISRGGADVMEVTKELTFFKPTYTVLPYDWTVTGDFFAHDYVIEKNGLEIASVRKEWLTWGDTYEIDISEGTDDVAVLSTVLVIDAVLAAQASSAN